MLTFPFGMPVERVEQKNRGRKRIFILGVYASAVHARWVGADGRVLVPALAVASEPEIFWCGEGAETIVARIRVPAKAGSLTAAGVNLNGPSGKTLNKRFLEPLGATRAEAWLCDLLPESRMNHRQAAALERSYDKMAVEWGLPQYNLPPVPRVLASHERQMQIATEVKAAEPDVFITLGDQPLRWFTKVFGSHSNLSAYGETSDTYGCLHDIHIAGRDMRLLPLVHPRQAGGLGTHSKKWAALHEHWAKSVAPGLLLSIVHSTR